MIFVFLYRYLFLLRQIYICVGLSGIPAATVVEAANEVALQGGSSKELPLNINLGGKNEKNVLVDNVEIYPFKYLEHLV